MADSFKGIGLFLLGLIFGLLIKILPLPQQIQTVLDQNLPIVVIGIFIIAVIVFVKG